MRRAPVSARLWVFDFDGTLSAIVPDRSGAALHPSCREMLAELAGMPAERVAVLSSRAVDDLVARVPVPSVFLGGGSGLEWRTPGGERIGPGRKAEEELASARERIQTPLDEIRAVRGVDVEDKRWSVAIHFRHAPPESRAALRPLLERLGSSPDLRVLPAPEAAELLLLRGADKGSGMRRLCRLLGVDPSPGRVAYAGDDENDAAAMRWVLARRGIAFAVGGRVAVRGAIAVDGPRELADAVLAIARGAPRGPGRAEKGVAAG